MHFLIIVVIVIIIVVIQLNFFSDTIRKIKEFFWIFPSNSDEYSLGNAVLKDEIDIAEEDNLEKMLQTAGLDSERYYYTKTYPNGEEKIIFRKKKARNDLKELLNNIAIISVSHDNITLKTIIDSINNYLRNNRTVSDFHLMKDIVDRNCDAKEEEISSQLPIPLYMGLVGTMAGILVGILYLWLSGGIGDLLSTGGGSGADGVEALLGGVALAMISSILGIVLTTLGSNRFKTARTQVETDKHEFLSWIQAKLLPTLSDNVVGAIRDMTGNLEKFNSEFAVNTGNLGSALETVNESYLMQLQLLESVRQIADKDLTQQNLQLYSALKNSTKEIETLAKYLANCNDYLANVRVLNEKLDLQESRTRTIEEVGKFFRDLEADSLKVVGKIDATLQEALEKLKEHTVSSLQELQKSSVKQQDILRQKTEEINSIVDELKNLSAIKESIAKFEKAMSAQNNKLDTLANAIQTLAKARVEGTSIPQKPIWEKALVIALSMTGGLLLALLIWNGILFFWNDIFKI